MSHEILLILDLDETLIHASATEVREETDFQVFHYFVYKRPSLVEFLVICAQHFQLAIWSSASDDYVRAVVQQILPLGITLEFVWGRSRCTPFTTPQLDDYGYYNLNGPSYIRVCQAAQEGAAARVFAKSNAHRRRHAG